MNDEFFGFFSRIPLTTQWRLYRETVAWVEVAEKAIAEGLALYSPRPAPETVLPLPRIPAALAAVVDVLDAQLVGVNALCRGVAAPEALAVYRERLPDRFLDPIR